MVVLVARLARRGVVELFGPDGAALLQGVVTNDVRQLAVGAAQACAFLNPKGRMVAEAILHRTGTERILVDTDAALAPRIAKLLQTAKLRKNVDIADASQRVAVWAAFGADNHNDALKHAMAAASENNNAPLAAVTDPRWSRLGARILLHATPNALHLGTAGQGLLAQKEEAYERWRILCGIPQGLEVDGAIPLEFNQDALHAVSFNKGCYTGQELTARTHFQGLVRKRIVPILIGTPTTTRTNSDIDDAEAQLIGRDAANLPPFKHHPLPINVMRHGDNAGEPAGKILAVARNSGIALALMRTDAHTDTWTTHNAFRLDDDTPVKAAPWPTYWNHINNTNNKE
jgi:folate-binding protein YgfZ